MSNCYSFTGSQTVYFDKVVIADSLEEARSKIEEEYYENGYDDTWEKNGGHDSPPDLDGYRT